MQASGLRDLVGRLWHRAKAFNACADDRTTKTMKTVFAGSVLVNHGSLTKDAYEAYQNPQVYNPFKHKNSESTKVSLVTRAEKAWNENDTIQKFQAKHYAKYVPLLIVGIGIALNAASLKTLVQAAITKGALLGKSCFKIAGISFE